MGSRGPLPSAHARRRNKRAANGRLLASRPAMPKELREEAQREWRRVVPVLEQLGVLSTIDRGVLIRYCTAWANWVELDGLIAQTGRLIKGREGTLVRNPLLLQRKDAGETLDRLSVQLGLTPVARLRSGIVHQREPEPEEVPPGLVQLREFRRRMEATS